MEDKDIKFGLAVLQNEYKRRRAILIQEEHNPTTRDNLLADLERIGASIVKIECKFEEVL